MILQVAGKIHILLFLKQPSLAFGMKIPPRLISTLIVVALTSSAFVLLHDDPGKKRTLKILCYNIHHAEPPSKSDVIDLNAIAKVINDHKPDLVALQEVDAFTGRSGPFNQAVELGKKTGMSAYFFKAINHDGGEYGVAILSRLPVSDTNLYPLPRMEGKGGEPRVLATATIELSAKEKFLFACTHLDSQRDSVNRLLQIKAIKGLLEETEVPVVIAGDFNATPGSEVIRILDTSFTRTCDPCEYTIPVDNPNKAIDFVAFTPAKRFRVKRHAVVPERYASDHLPVFAELEIVF
jgi:endonuclease/exonuclease/phosphatase family metal-dependent hydrolase